MAPHGPSRVGFSNQGKPSTDSCEGGEGVQENKTQSVLKGAAGLQFCAIASDQPGSPTRIYLWYLERPFISKINLEELQNLFISVCFCKAGILNSVRSVNLPLN